MWAYNVNQDVKPQLDVKALRGRGLIAFVIVAVVVVAVLAGYRVPWTGFSSYVNGDGRLQPPKGLWDWMQLLVVPAVLALGGYWLNQSQSNRAQNAATDDQQEKALQAYLDSMTELLLTHGLRESQPGSEVRTVARVRTMTALRILNNNRKSIIIQFLVESGLIQNNGPVSLRNADLSRLYLANADLHGVDFHMAYLYGTYFTAANLRGADLSEANLYKADLSGADLTGANLAGAHYDEEALQQAL